MMQKKENELREQLLSFKENLVGAKGWLNRE